MHWSDSCEIFSLNKYVRWLLLAAVETKGMDISDGREVIKL